MSMTRKDYGEAAIVPESNPVMKRINALNAPNSSQATLPNWESDDNVFTDYDAIALNQRVLYGNKDGYVSDVTMDDAVLGSIDVTFKREFVELGSEDGPEMGTITYTKAELEATDDLIILKDVYAPIVLVSIAIDPDEASIEEEATVQLSAIGTYEDENESVLSGGEWDSENDAIATVSVGGLVTGVAAGEVDITYTVGTVVGTATITVTEPE